MISPDSAFPTRPDRMPALMHCRKEGIHIYSVALSGPNLNDKGVSMLGRVTCLLLTTMLAPGVSTAQAQATQTTCTAVQVAHKVGHDCTSNTCAPGSSKNDCASCLHLTLGLPQGSTVMAKHCKTVAHYPNDYGHGDLHEIACTTDNSWSIFDDPAVSSTGNGVTVSTTFRNRSSDRDRDAQLCVDWK